MKIPHLLVAAGMLGLSGCYVNTIRTGLPPSSSQVIEQKAEFFLYGVIGEAHFDLQQICPNGVSEIRESQEFVDGLLQMVTCGIYMPLTVQITCASGATYRLIPDEGRGGSWVQSIAASMVTPTAGAGS